MRDVELRSVCVPEAVAAALDCPVLTNPDSAVLWLRRAVIGAAKSD